jgi:hypothetical protein
MYREMEAELHKAILQMYGAGRGGKREGRKPFGDETMRR